MSKIFDALRRAEEERRKRAGLSKDKKNIPAQRSTTPPQQRPEVVGFPKGLLKELGILRNAIDSALEGKAKKAIIFTSATSGEGTTTIGTSYARLLALQGTERILLCEMNTRNPRIKHLFSLNSNFGVTDYFSGTKSLASISHPTTGENLDVIQAGSGDPALVQIQVKQVFPALVKETLDSYDTVIFDAPAIISSPETPPMTSHVDGIVLVVHAGKTKREIVQRSMDTVTRSGGNILGVILNRKKYYIPGFLYKRI